MPSFFEGLKRMISGQPVFRPGEGADGISPKEEKEFDQESGSRPVPGDTTNQQTPPATQYTSGPKIRPQAVIERVECHLSGPYMNVNVHIQNQSNGELMLDKILIFGQTRELDYQMRPGEAREFVDVYRGQRFNNRNYTNCEVQYRDATGDYFSAIHNIEFKQEPDGTYSIERIRFIPPVKDI